MLDAVSADATSDALDVSMRHKLSVECVLENILGTATVGFSVSNDGVNFVDYNRINSNVVDDNTETDARVATIALSGAAPRAMVLFPEGDYFKQIKAIYTTVTGGIVTSSIDDAGTGYSAEDVLTIADGTAGTITVLTVGGSGEVLTYELTTPGTDYSIGVHESTGGGGSDFALDVLTVDAGDVTCTLQNVD